ncbi:mitochondrial calcium uniporter isoform X1 [Leptinotarsa decemlineata]|uniref:mitochondrial calcium uniporter isoform X1 n=1 Tax=Leptinotarsa decemlineata TaxID=7539 RepID=UPI003D3058DA
MRLDAAWNKNKADDMSVPLKMALPRVLCRARLLLNNDFSVVSKYSSVVSSVSINKCVQIRTVKQFRTHFSSDKVLNSKKKDDKDSDNSISLSSSSSDSDSDSDLEDDVTVVYYKGLPQVTVPLPSRRERCRFTLKPITNTVGEFLEMLKKEDKGIDRVVCMAKDGTRIASSNTIETLLDDDFKLIINDNSYNVNTPKQERVTGEEIQRLNDVKNLVSQLYEAMHIQEHQITKEKELTTQLEMIQQELLPLEQKKNELELVAQRRGNWLSWAGLGLMSVQFGILARLTWWEYSWDIMEPVTYFVTYGTAMACYAYFVLTKEEYILQDVRDRQHLIIMHKKAKKLGMDLNQYNMLRQEAVQIQSKLKKLRNPLKLKLPPNVLARQMNPLMNAVPGTTSQTTTVDPKEASGVLKGSACATAAPKDSLTTTETSKESLTKESSTEKTSTKESSTISETTTKEPKK